MPSQLVVTRFVHSCLLVEAGGQVVLFDPGRFSFESGLFDLESIDQIDTVVITHEHDDHFYLPFVQQVVKKFPGVNIITTAEVSTQLEGIPAESLNREGVSGIKVFNPPHAGLPFGSAPPQNIGIHFAEVLTHPGDSHDFSETMPVLAMPMTAPWGSMTSAIDKILQLKPQTVIPIHDWHWKTEAATIFYKRFQSALSEQGISFLVPTDGQSETINLT